MHWGEALTFFLLLAVRVAALPLEQGGNNNTYCHDSSLNWLDWDAATAGNGFSRFFRNLIALRRPLARPPALPTARGPSHCALSVPD